MPAKPRSWIVVADRKHCRFLLHSKPGAALEPAGPEEIVLNLSPSSDDRAGRVHERKGPGRHSIEPTSHEDEKTRRQLANEAAEVINRAHHGRRFDRLVLVAPPATLGALRQALSTTSRDSIAAEVPKQLLRATPGQLAARLSKLGTLGLVADRVIEEF